MRNDQDLFVRYRHELLKRGIFKLPMNLKRNHISHAHTGAHIDRTLEACRDVLRSLARESRESREKLRAIRG